MTYDPITSVNFVPYEIICTFCLSIITKLSDFLCGNQELTVIIRNDRESVKIPVIYGKYFQSTLK